MTTSDTITFEVTADDIAAGIPSDIHGCAIACALKRLPGWNFSGVEINGADVDCDGSRWILDQEAQGFARMFDADKTGCAPGTFTMELLCQDGDDDDRVGFEE